MNDDYFPYVELRIHHLGKEITNAFACHVDELKPYVGKAVERALSDENMQNEINVLVNKCVKETITEALGCWEVKEALNLIIKNELLCKLNPAPNTSGSEPVQCLTNKGQNTGEDVGK